MNHDKSFVDKLFMSFVKVFGMYQQLPADMKITGGFLFLLFMGPFFPTGYFMYGNQDVIPIPITIIYVVFYLVITLVITIMLMKYAKRWRQGEYDEISTGLAVMRFLLFAFLYSMVHYVLFRVVLQLLLNK